MSVFCIGNIDIRDFEKYRNSGYLENAARTITEYGGRYRVRGGQTKIIEGQPVLHRLVVIEFPSMESFENWYSSDAYAPWKKIRQELSETDFFCCGRSDRGRIRKNRQPSLNFSKSTTILVASKIGESSEKKPDFPVFPFIPW